MFVKAVGYVNTFILKGACEEPLGTEEAIVPPLCKVGRGAVCLTGYYLYTNS